LLAVRAEAFTEWPGASVAYLVQPGERALGTRSAAQFLPALSIVMIYVRSDLVVNLLDQKA
jgi:hypothetical protein